MATTTATVTVPDHAHTTLIGAEPPSTHHPPIPALNTSIPNHTFHENHSDVSALDEMQSVAPGSSISMQDEDTDSILVAPDRRVPFNQQNGVGPSPLRQSELGDLESSAVGTNADEITSGKKPRATVEQEPRPQVMAPQHRAPPVRNNYPVPPGEDPNDFVVPLEQLKEWSAPVDCTGCHKRTMTRTTKESGDTVTIWAVVLCCLTGLLCAWIPCVMDDCKDTFHYCSNCRCLLAQVSNSGKVTVKAPLVPVRSQYAQPLQYKAQSPKEQPKELDARDNKVVGAEAAGVPVSELPQTTVVRSVGGPPQEIEASEKNGIGCA